MRTVTINTHGDYSGNTPPIVHTQVTGTSIGKGMFTVRTLDPEQPGEYKQFYYPLDNIERIEEAEEKVVAETPVTVAPVEIDLSDVQPLATPTPLTTKEARKLWVEALRSGDYQQGIKGLHNPALNTYCCLGVACDVAEKHGVTVSRHDNGAFPGGYLGGHIAVMDWLGLRTPQGGFVVTTNGDDTPTHVTTLANLNDECGYNFQQIADVIESEPEGLFVDEAPVDEAPVDEVPVEEVPVEEVPSLTPQEARKLWVEALRSGEYQQGRSLLHDGNSYCCLGVACVLAEQHGIPVRRGDTSKRIMGGTPDQEVLDWLGLRNCDGRYNDAGNTTSLVVRNDVDRWGFKSIANLIESEPEGLFVD